MKIVIEIELGSDEMKTGMDVVYALCGNAQIEIGNPLRTLSHEEELVPGTCLPLRDVNRAVVGKIEVLP